MNVLHVVRCVINLDSLLFLTLHEQHQCKLLTSLISYSYSFFFSCSLTVKLKLFKDLYLFKSFLSRNFLTCEVRKKCVADKRIRFNPKTEMQTERQQLAVVCVSGGWKMKRCASEVR